MTARLGDLEVLVLLALLRLRDEAYGVAIQRDIADRTGQDVSFGSVYTALGRLEEKGFVTGRLGDPSPVRGGRRKKYFRVQAAGKQALRESLRAIHTMSRGLGPAWSAR
jgi:DNA-binding PadR family transcriptional regulator